MQIIVEEKFKEGIPLPYLAKANDNVFIVYSVADAINLNTGDIYTSVAEIDKLNLELLPLNSKIILKQVV